AADMSQASFSDLLVGAINCESQIGAQILNPLDGDLTLEATGGTLRILDGFGLNGGGNRHDATLRAGRNIDFDAAITGLQDLTARAGTDGNGSVNIRTSLLDINGDAVFAAADDINLSPTFPFINIWTNGSQTYDGDLVANATAQLISWQNGGLELTGDLLFDGSPFVLMRSVGGSVYVDGSIDTSFAGLGRFVANAQTGNVWINGDIGAVNPLNAMELTAEDGLIILSGDLVRAREDIFLNNFEGRRTAFADIIGLSDNLEIRSENGGIYIGKNHKFTQLGDLTLRAINGEITLNDVSTFGNLLVDSPMISIFLREPLEILTYLGFDVESFVVNFVAGGSISFTSAPTTVGDGGTPWFSSVNDSPDASTTLEDFVWWQNVPLDMQDFYFDTVVLVLEAVQESGPTPPEPPIPPDPPQPPGPPNPPVPPAPPAPNPDDPSLAIAEGSQIAEPPVDLLIFADSDTDGSILLTDLGDIGIEVEGPANSDSELRGSLSRSRVVSDYTANAINVNPDTGNIRVKQARISTKVTDQALQEYQNVLVRQPGDATTILEQNQTTAMSDSIQQAWTSYRDSAGSDATGDGFRSWLDSSGNTQAREFVNGLRTVYTTLKASGLNGPELNHARNTAMGRILKSGTSQSGMSTADLSAATGS
ncbi:MAG: hypothetical protein VX727_08230, partial [Planctomycetota bacterium]|nr:hypothetical protein [Planctomycetota bacterium]